MSRRIECPKCGTKNQAGTVCECVGGLERRIIRPWVGNLRHARDLCDDWGSIRDETGRLILTVMVPPMAHIAGWEKYRKDGTDPTQPVVDAILSALNGLDQARAAQRADHETD
jgi:hypothetical protein